MTKFSNVVRFKVKPEYVNDFLQHFVELPSFEGKLSQILIKTSEHNYCAVGLWESEAAVVAARPAMIASLNTARHMLDEISPDMGVTDAVSGPVVVER